MATKRFRDGFFPSQEARIKEEFERLKRRPSPDLVFCPRRDDAHQDHRVVAELAWNTFRDHLILEYEIPKYDGDLATPNVYVPLDEDDLPEEDRPHRPLLPVPERKPVDVRRHLLGGAAAARHRVQRALRRGIHMPEGDALALRQRVFRRGSSGR